MFAEKLCLPLSIIMLTIPLRVLKIKKEEGEETINEQTIVSLFGSILIIDLLFVCFFLPVCGLIVSKSCSFFLVGCCCCSASRVVGG